MDPRYTIDADEVLLGHDVVIEAGASISGIQGRARRVQIGDNVFIGADTKIRVPELVIGDFTRINNHSLIYGYDATHIGHNCWFGQNVVLNSTAPLTIGHNCCVSAYSQLWTHFSFGDVLQGCRFSSSKPLTLEEDVWIATHCVISPIVARARSMALPGAIVTHDMEFNRVYAGNPARDVTERMGPQFAPVTDEHKLAMLQQRLDAFLALNPQWGEDAIGIQAGERVTRPGLSMFDVASRRYTKRRTPAEVAFMQFLLPSIKFLPEA